MVVEQPVTAEQFVTMSEVPGKRLELAERTLFGARIALIGMNVFRERYAHVEERNLGEVFMSSLGYILHRDPDTVRMATASFIATSSIPDVLPEGCWPGAPDIALEIASPGDRAEIVHARILDFLKAGARLVWVLWPKQCAINVHHPDGMTHELGPDDSLDGGDVLPGFSVRVGELFAMPTRP